MSPAKQAKIAMGSDPFPLFGGFDFKSNESAGYLFLVRNLKPNITPREENNSQGTLDKKTIISKPLISLGNTIQ